MLSKTTLHRNRLRDALRKLIVKYKSKSIYAKRCKAKKCKKLVHAPNVPRGTQLAKSLGVRSNTKNQQNQWRSHRRGTCQTVERLMNGQLVSQSAYYVDVRYRGNTQVLSEYYRSYCLCHAISTCLRRNSRRTT